MELFVVSSSNYKFGNDSFHFKWNYILLDLDGTKEAIINASSLPMSIIVCHNYFKSLVYQLKKKQCYVTFTYRLSA